MKKILIAIDDTKGTKEIFAKCALVCDCMRPETIILLYVEKFEGRSFIDEMLGEAEMNTLRNVLEGTEFKAALDAKAQKIGAYYKGVMEASASGSRVNTVIRTGQPAEEILKLAEEEKVDMIFVGSSGKRRWSSEILLMGSVSREVANLAKCPVLIVK